MICVLKGKSRPLVIGAANEGSGDNHARWGTQQEVNPNGGSVHCDQNINALPPGQKLDAS